MAIAKYGEGYRVFIDAGFDMEGHRIRVSRVTTSMREAKRIERELIEEVNRVGKLGWRVNVADFADRYYIPSLDALATSTRHAYVTAINKHVKPSLGEMELKDITPADIQRMLNGIQTRGAQDNAHKAIRQLFSYAQAQGIASSNPAKAKFTKVQKVPPAEAILETAEEMAAFAAAIKGSPVEAAALLCLGAGLRKGEALGCDWSDIDFKAGTVTVRQSYMYVQGKPFLKTPKTAQSNRTVPVAQWVLRRLREIRGGEQVLRMGPVAVDSSGARLHPEAASDLLDKAIVRSPAKRVTMKNLRHSFATFAIASGIEVATVSKWLGHTEIMTTYKRYVRVGDKHLHKGVELLDRAFGL